MKFISQGRAIRYRLISIPSVLLVVALIYIATYLNLAYVPGNDPLINPLGWWAWFDQGQYLTAAQAFARGDFLAEHYFYPPLYSALGSLFLNVTGNHPFFLINLLCLLWFVYVFIRLSDLYVPRVVGLFLLFVSIIFPVLILENFVIPWTSNLSMALLATGVLGLVWIEEIKQAKRRSLQYWQVVLVAMSLGLMVPTRPVDALIGLLIGCAFIFSYLRLPSGPSIEIIPSGRFLTLATMGAVVGPACFIAFNYGVYGAPLGNYLQVASSHGFFMADLPEKFFSIWINAQPLYGEAGAGLIEHYPWLLLSLAGLVWVLLRGDMLLRTLAVAITIFFILYLPYGDLLPTGLWRFLNIHYFKWTFPLLALFAAILLGGLVRGVRMRSSWQLPLALLTVVPLLLLSLQMRIIASPLAVKLQAGGALEVDLPAQVIDFVDIKGLSGEFNKIYFGAHTLQLDGWPLQLYRDFRLLDHGADIRILFIRPIQGRTLQLSVDPHLQWHQQQLNAQWGTYRFAIGFASSLDFSSSAAVLAAYRLNQIIDFSNQGKSDFYIGQGFSIAEEQGRWTLNDGAALALRVMDLMSDKKVYLHLTYKALLAGEQACQQVGIIVNGQNIGNTRLCLSEQGQQAQTYHYEIPASAIDPAGLMHILIQTPDSVSARQLKINTDERKLGVYVQQLVITQ